MTSSSRSDRNPGTALARLRFGLVAALALTASRSEASEGRELLVAAEAAEAAAEPRRAYELYRKFEDQHHGERLARRARARTAWLEARSEGEFGPLSELIAMRTQASASPEPAALRAFAARVATFPSGRVRREAYELLGDTWLTRLDSPTEALAYYLAWSQEPGINEAERQLAASGIALCRARIGKWGAALGDLERLGLTDRSEARYLRAERVKRIASGLGIAALVIHGLQLLVEFVRRRARPSWRATIGQVEVTLAALTLGLPILFVERFDSQLVRPFAPAIAAMALALALNWLAAGLLPPDARHRRLAAGGAVSVLAAGLVASTHTGMLTELLMAAWEPR